MLSLVGIKSFVFARQTSTRRKFSARLAVQKQSFLFSWDSTWPPSDKGLLSALNRRRKYWCLQARSKAKTTGGAEQKMVKQNYSSPPPPPPPGRSLKKQTE